MPYCNLVGLKEKLKELKQDVPWLETPFIWDFPPHLKDNMPHCDLEKVITNKMNEINDFQLEKIAVHFLEWIMQYFLKTLLERTDLDEQFRNCRIRIEKMEAKGLTPYQLREVRVELNYLLFCTEYAVHWLRGEPIDRVHETPASKTTVTGIKAWYNMVLYNYDPAMKLFESIANTPEYTPLFAFYHGKTIARQRRRKNDRYVTAEEIKLLLTARDRRLALPVILNSFENAGETSAVFFKFKSEFEEILKKAWESRDAYHSQNSCRLASIYTKRNEDEKAKELFEMSIRLNPKCSMTLHKFGNFLMKKGQIEKGSRLMIQANHMPAFFHLIRQLKFPNDHFYDLPALFDKIELVMTEIPIALPIRYTIYKYYLEHRNMAKALHHLQVLYTETKQEPEFTFAESASMRSDAANLIAPGKKMTIPEKINIEDECKQLRKMNKVFNTWMEEMEKKQSGYQVLDLAQL